MTQRPTVSVLYHKNPSQVSAEVRLPHVFMAPVRNDVVSFVHDQLSKNTRQAHGVDPKAGMKHSAESWGTGRAVARIPRVSGSGTHRSGQAAFGNMCRKGRMSHPLHTWRRWHRKVNLKQRRHALASAVAASACVPLVMARGHRVMNVPMLPLVVDDTVSQVSRTKELITVLKALGCWDDVKRVVAARKMRPGKGKLRNKRFKARRGVLLVAHDGCESLRRAVRNIPGVDMCNVGRLNLRQLAPGGHLGRFCLWTQSAFTSLESHFGSGKGVASLKKGYKLQKEVVSSADLSNLINSDAIQSVLKDKKPALKKSFSQKKNPLRNQKQMTKLNPYSTVLKGLRQGVAGQKKKITKEDMKARRVRSRAAKTRHNETIEKVNAYTAECTETYKDQIRQMRV